jgi:tetratricopeptide (TPR) repeat protein
MRQRRRKINWFFIAVVVLLIAVVTYIDRFVLTVENSPFMPTATVTRDPESYVTDAEALFNDGKLINAIDMFMEAIRLKPDDPALYIAVARVQIFAGRYGDALVNTENALLLNPDNSMAHALRGWALTQQGDYVAADESIKKALTLDANNGLAHAYNAFLLGRMAVENTGPYVNPIENAIEESRVAVALAPNSLEAHWARGYIYQITDNRELAIQEYLTAININSNISELHLDLGVTYRANSNFDEAIQQYTLANTLNPTDFRPDLYSSRALASIGEFGKAIQYAETAVRDAPTDPYLRGNWAYTLFKNNEWLSALEQFALAINGGQTDDGQTIQALSPAGNETWSANDTWIAQYYYTYAILLALSNRCGEALPLTQTILDAFRSNEYAVYNATYAQGLCAESAGATPAQPSATPEITPTP